MPEEIARVAEAFPFVAGVWVMELEERQSVFVAFDTLSQRDVVAFHSKLVTYVAEDALEGLNFCLADRLPPGLERRGRRIELTASDRATAQMMLEQRERIRSVELANAVPSPPPSKQASREPPESTPPVVMVGGFVMPVGARNILASEAREAIVAEAMAWDQAQDAPALRSASLAGFPPFTQGVLELAMRRAALLREMGRYPTERRELHGRLLSCELMKRRPFVVVPEVFEADGMPAWDLWCWSMGDRLVAWIPRRLEHLVAIQAALTPGRYRWLPFLGPEAERL